CTGFIEQVIKILEEVGTLSENNRDQLIETKEYNDCSTLIFEIEYYFKKLDQVNSNQFVVKESLKKFVLNLEIVVNAIQRASEHLKPKKVSKWSPSIVSKIKTIGKLMVMKKESDRIKDDSDFAPLMHEEEHVIQQGLNIPTSEVEDPSNIPTSVEDPLNVPTSVEDPIEVPVIVEDPLKVPTSEKEDPIEPIIQREVIFTESLIREDESPNEPIIQQDIIMPTGFIKQELIISTGLNRGGNNEGMFFNNKVSEKCIGIIPRDDIKFTKFQNEMSYLMKLSCGCNNILSVKGFTERSIMDNPSILIYIVNYLISSLFLKLTYRNKYATMLVTEWAEFNLPDYLEKNDLDWSAKLSIARGIANALNHIHNLNLLHYNVKSDSVLLDHNLEPKLHKFGMDAKDCVFLKSARSLKSSNWSAPEVKRGGKYTSASEVYSFGVILWEIATQECLSGNKSIDKRDIDDAPTNYLTLMKSALDQEPQNRPTMQEMFDSLSQFESFYSARQQKQQNLSIRNIINILHTNSVVSSSSEDHLTIVTSRANSPAPSISDHEYMFFTNNVNTTSKVENSTDIDEFTVSESTSSIEKSSTVNVNDTSNLEKSSIFTNHVVESPISTKNVDCNSDNENSSTFTHTNDVDYHSDTEISTFTNDVDYHSDTESSTIFTKDVEINAENSLTSTNDVDYHSDTESSTIFIKDVETNAEKSTTFTNDVDYHSDTENSTTITNNVETNAENSPTFTNNVDHNSNIEILQTLTNDIKSTSNIEKSSSTIIHH
ncbi:17262_t:CDS:2, partial [Funneliformis caledonium]